MTASNGYVAEERRTARVRISVSGRDTSGVDIVSREACGVCAVELRGCRWQFSVSQSADARKRCWRGAFDDRLEAQRAGVSGLDREARACPKRARSKTIRLFARDSRSTESRRMPAVERSANAALATSRGSAGRQCKRQRRDTAGAKCIAEKYKPVSPRNTDQPIDQPRSETRARERARRWLGVRGNRASTRRPGRAARTVLERSRTADHRGLGKARHNHASAVTGAGESIARQAWRQRAAGVPRPDRHRAVGQAFRGTP